MKRLFFYLFVTFTALAVTACSNHVDQCLEYTDLRKPPQECKYSDGGENTIKQEAPSVPTDDDAEAPTPDTGGKPPSGDHGPKPKDDNGHGNDPGKHDPSNPGKGDGHGKDRDKDHGHDKGKGHGKHGQD